MQAQAGGRWGELGVTRRSASISVGLLLSWSIIHTFLKKDGKVKKGSASDNTPYGDVMYIQFFVLSAMAPYGCHFFIFLFFY